LAGAFPVRFASCKTAFTPTHPFILCALAIGGAIPAAAAGVAGVLGAALRPRCRMTPIRAMFNVGTALLATGSAAGVFLALGGTPGRPWPTLLGPLAVGACCYFFANTALVAIAVGLDKRVDPLDAWATTLLWTAASYFSGLTLAVGLLAALDTAGSWGLLLGIPPVALLVQFYQSYRRRLEESEDRVREVERLNGRLETTVGELREALAHVKSLQGLLPICMHCKSIRDDNDAWHRLDAYISEHTDVTFTHSLCKPCQEKHYSRKNLKTAAKT
jgi:hypothetical protein